MTTSGIIRKVNDRYDKIECKSWLEKNPVNCNERQQ